MNSIGREPVFRVSDQVQHKLGCTVTEDGQRLEIPDLGSRRIVLYVHGYLQLICAFVFM